MNMANPRSFVPFLDRKCTIQSPNYRDNGMNPGPSSRAARFPRKVNSILNFEKSSILSSLWNHPVSWSRISVVWRSTQPKWTRTCLVSVSRKELVVDKLIFFPSCAASLWYARTQKIDIIPNFLQLNHDEASELNAPWTRSLVKDKRRSLLMLHIFFRSVELSMDR